MARRRRIAVAVLAALAVLGVAGCRQEAGTAAYVGDTRYTDDQVRQAAAVVAGVHADLTSPAGIAQLYVLRDLAKQLTDEKSWQASQPVTAMQVAQGQRVPESSEYAKLRAEVETYLAAIREHVQPVKPTDADLHDLYNRAGAAGLVGAGDTFAAVAPQLDSPQLESALATRNALLDVVKRNNVAMNPRYPAEYPLLSFQQGNVPAVVVPLTTGTSTSGVADAPGRTTS